MGESLVRARRFLVPEVVQTSAMDCGPATLTCLLAGFGIPVHYGRLREACQTDVDGTSIDVLEDVAGKLGLAADQVMVPVDHLLLPEAKALPAVLVVTKPNGWTHFVLVWRRHGPFVQVMDPAVGRRWLPCRRLLEEAYVHTQRLPARAWHEWTLSDDFQRPLLRRIGDLGLGRSGRDWIEKAAAATDWRPLAGLDAAVRLSDTLVQSGGLRRGRESRDFLRTFVEAGPAAPPDGLTIPDKYWSVLPALPVRQVDNLPTQEGPSGEEQVLVRGAVLIRVQGRRLDAESPAAAAVPLSPELAAARSEPASRPGRTLWQLLRGHGRLALLLIAAGLALAAAGGVLEAVLLRATLDAGRDLRLPQQRLVAIGLLGAFAAVLLLLDFGLARSLARLGRYLECRLRAAFMEKIPRLNDRYFQSRPISDMASRGHALHQVRLLPRLAGQFGRAALLLVFTAGAIAWVEPAAAPVAFLAAALAIGLPLAFCPVLAEADLRVQAHSGAVSNYYLDALRGLAAVRAHGAQRAVLREHEGLLVEWARAGRRLLGWTILVHGLQGLIGFALAGWLVCLHAGCWSDTGGALLLAYWALSLPTLGEEIILLLRQYPLQRNVLLRLLEPLGALTEPTEEERANQTVLSPLQTAPGVAITMEGVTVRAAGHTILEDIELHIPAGGHVAIVGASGAGKSSLVGLLLGWHRPAAGQVLVDGGALTGPRLDRLRQETAWVDPAVQLWNRPLLDNLLYGSPRGGELPVGDALQAAELFSVLRRLPEGMQTGLGEGGGFLSGGEGQRARFGRALLRPGPRLVILDEPFRGLDRGQRRELLQRARRHWAGATLLCITHDVGETRDFERVLVIDAGRIREDGSPTRLAQDVTSRYRALLDAEAEVREGLWSSCVWRHLRLEDGHLQSLSQKGDRHLADPEPVPPLQEKDGDARQCCYRL
jgi:ATP-binding cassette subfamily B protein